jgi:hypothetical protein
MVCGDATTGKQDSARQYDPFHWHDVIENVASTRGESELLPRLEIARVLVRFNHVVSSIVNANHSVNVL